MFSPLQIDIDHWHVFICSLGQLSFPEMDVWIQTEMLLPNTLWPYHFQSQCSSSLQRSSRDLLVPTWYSFTKIQLPWKGHSFWNSTLFHQILTVLRSAPQLFDRRIHVTLRTLWHDRIQCVSVLKWGSQDLVKIHRKAASSGGSKHWQSNKSESFDKMLPWSHYIEHLTNIHLQNKREKLRTLEINKKVYDFSRVGSVIYYYILIYCCTNYS